MRNADFLPSAPWRRQSLVVDNSDEPNTPPLQSVGADSLPRQVFRKPSEERLRFPSLRKPKRVPSQDSSSKNFLRKPQRQPSKDSRTNSVPPRQGSGCDTTTSSSSLSRRKRSFFGFRRSTKSSISTGAHTDAAIHPRSNEKHRRHAIVDLAANDDNDQTDTEDQRRPSVASSGGFGSTEATELETDLMLDPETAHKLDLLRTQRATRGEPDDDDDDNRSQGSRGPQFRKSLNLQQIFFHGSKSKLLGGSSRQGFGKSRSFTKRSSASNNSSLLSSLSSAFSSVRGGNFFVFTASNSDRNLAEQDGHKFPDIVVDHGNLEDRLHSGSNHREEPPRCPSRHDSSSCSYAGSYCSFSCSTNPDGSSSCECGNDGVALRKTGRRTSLRTPIAAIVEAEQEVDGSTLMMANREEESEHSLSTRKLEEENDSGEFSKSGPLHRSAPVAKVGVSEEVNQFLAAKDKKPHRRSAPATTPPIIKRGSGTSILSLAEELPFPVRRESISSQSQVSSQSKQWKKSIRVPDTVPPEATVMEKKELLKRKLTFSKQQLGTVLQEVSKRGGTD